jgi:hypothetical protein
MANGFRESAAELMRVGTATLRTAAGDLQARIIRFRKEAVMRKPSI